MFTKYDNPLYNLKRWIYAIPYMYPRIKKYGIKYLFSKVFRHKCRRKESNIRHKRLYGSFNSNRKKIKSALFYKRGNICFWCGEKMKFHEATIDHIIPVSIKRDNTLQNLRLIHEKCRVDRDTAIQKGILNVSYNGK